MKLDPEQLQVAEAVPEGIVIARARAGAGKSSTIRRRVPFILRYRDAFHQTRSKVLVMAFNAKIANELAEHFKNTLSEADQKRVVCKTTHSQALGMLYRNRQWSEIQAEEFAVTKLSSMKTQLMDWLETQGLEHLTVETVLAAIGLESFANARGLSLEEAYGDSRARRGLSQLITSKQAFDLIKKIRSYRMNSGQIIFDDFLPLANALPAQAFQNCKFTDVVVDECQDLNYQQQKFVLRFMNYAESLTAVGDSEQCFLPGTLVSTPTGLKPIETMCQGDEVTAAFGRGTTKTTLVQQALCKSYSGWVYTFKTESGREITATADHPMFTRIEAQPGRHFVYLMHRADKGFRVGVTAGERIGYSGSSPGLLNRIAAEKADEAWIIRICATRQEALAYEQIYSTKYGIPQACFEDQNHSTMTSVELDLIFDHIDTRRNARILAEAHGLDLSKPMFSSKHGENAINMVYFGAKGEHHMVTYEFSGAEKAEALKKSGVTVTAAKSSTNIASRYRVRAVRSAYSEARDISQRMSAAIEIPVSEKFSLVQGQRCHIMIPACNVVPGMLTPVLDESGAVLEDMIVTIERREYFGPVYDLNVAKVHNYVANGIVVHNCINGFSGATSKIFDNLVNDYKDRPVVDVYVSTTYRCPEPVVEIANKILERDLGQKVLMRGTSKEGPPVELITNGAPGMIEFLHQREASGEPWSDMTVLFRWKREKIALEAALAKSKIPYVITDGSFFDAYEIQDVLCYLRCLYEPAPAYEHWRRVIGHYKGLGAKTAELAFEHANGRPFQNLADSLWMPRIVSGDPERVNSWRLMTDRMSYLMRERANLTKVVDYVIKELEPKWAEYHEGRLEAIVESKEILNAFRDWVLPFSEGLELLGEVDVYEQKNLKDEPGINAIHVGTAHSAKGLEFPTVVLWNVGVGLGLIKKTMNEEEALSEHRLMYVAVTRAKRSLALICRSPDDIKNANVCSYVRSHKQLASALIDWSAFDDPLADFGVG